MSVGFSELTAAMLVFMGGDMAAGHRARMRERFKESDIEGFADHNILEMLLFGAVSRRDTNPMSHALMERFGSLRGVLSASEDELAAISGIGSAAAHYIKLNAECIERVMACEGAGSAPCVINSEEGVRYCLTHLPKGESGIRVLALSGDDKPLSLSPWQVEAGDSFHETCGKLFRLTASVGGRSAIVIFIRASGVKPSAYDEYFMQQLSLHFSSLDFKVCDCLIMDSPYAYSLFSKQYYKVDGDRVTALPPVKPASSASIPYDRRFA